MVRGLYTSAWGMIANTKKMDVVANNLANASTTGFKRDDVVLSAFQEQLYRRMFDTRSTSNPSASLGKMSLGVDVGEVVSRMDQGMLEKTDAKMNFALKDDKTAFFSVEKDDGQGNTTTYLQRSGNFSRNSDGYLVNQDGAFVLGENGRIFLASGQIEVDAQGRIMEGGNVIDTLKVRGYDNPKNLRKVGENLWKTEGDAGERENKGTVMQGYLEASNVNVVREMMDMISVTRLYETNQRMIVATDTTLEKAVNEVGAVR